MEEEKIEKVEKLSAKAGVTLEEAKSALESSGWDMLDAMILLEKQGKGARQATYTTENEAKTEETKYESNKSQSFGETVGKVFKWIGHIISKGMDNDVVIKRDGKKDINIPITIAVIIFLVLNGLAVVLVIVSLFFGIRYAFEGPDINGRAADTVNETMGKATDKAGDFAQEIKDGYNK